MATVAYIFLARESQNQIPFTEQHGRIAEFAGQHGLVPPGEVFIESKTPLDMPLEKRSEGGKLLAGLRRGDVVICLKAEWVLAGPRAGAELLTRLREAGVSLYCGDLQEDLAQDGERKLVVSTGVAGLVQNLLRALAVCAEQGEADGERRVLVTTTTGASQEVAAQDPGPADAAASERSAKRFAGGAVPFGWRLDADGCLEIDEQQQEVILAMQQMREERVSYRAMSRRLHEEHGVSLSSEGIRKILMRQQATQENK